MRNTRLYSELVGMNEKARHGKKAHSLDFHPVSSGGTASVDGVETTLLQSFSHDSWDNVLYTVSESLAPKITQ